ncbi:hypothetical protein TNCV_2158531 [Trichonephila clavipes]|nr:hypothetical protein TNCV_2158531 [Trichonephila clavipes]
MNKSTGLMTGMTSELPLPFETTTPYQREDFERDILNMHQLPNRHVFSGTRLKFTKHRLRVMEELLRYYNKPIMEEAFDM